MTKQSYRLHNNLQTHVMIDHYMSKVTIFNYNHHLFSDFGVDRNELSIDWLIDCMSTADKKLLSRYADIIVDYFLSKRKDYTKYIYFSICYNYKHECANGSIQLKIIPLVYTEDKNLYASLCVLDSVSYEGKPILKMHKVDENKTFVYVSSSGKFVNEEETRLSKIERDILCMSGEGAKEQDIAHELDIPLFYLKRCKNSIFVKLKVKTIAEAIYVAYKQGCL
ncbi:MAG: hypothetical protein ACRC13_04675 [Tannerellaceae bacterium]